MVSGSDPLSDLRLRSSLRDTRLTAINQSKREGGSSSFLLLPPRPFFPAVTIRRKAHVAAPFFLLMAFFYRLEGRSSASSLMRFRMGYSDRVVDSNAPQCTPGQGGADRSNCCRPVVFRLAQV